MKKSRKDLLEILTVRTETIKLDCLQNTNLKDMDFLLKEMNLAQSKKYQEILNDKEDKDRFDKCMKYACREVMIEPSFFTDEEIQNMNGLGKVMMDEIFTKIPTIGMSENEKKTYFSKVQELSKKQSEKKDEAKEDIEKK